MNKKYFILFYLILAFLEMPAQGVPADQVPSVFSDSLNQKFPGSQNIYWSKLANSYKVDFTDAKGNESEIEFDAQARWITIAGKCPGDCQKSLPAPVRSGLKKAAKGGSVESLIVFKRRGFPVVYFANIVKGEMSRYITLDEKGKEITNK